MVGWLLPESSAGGRLSIQAVPMHTRRRYDCFFILDWYP
jgi:hypothetical protein